MRKFGFAFLTLSLLAIAATSVQAQFPPPTGGGGPGGDRGSRGGGFSRGGNIDPDAIWNRMANGADTVDLNKDPRLKGMVQMGGGTLPPDGILRKEEWKAQFQQRMAARNGGMAPPSSGTSTSAPSAAPATDVKVIAVSGSSSGPPARWNDEMEGSFRRYSGGADTISREQAMSSRRGLSNAFDQYDANRDGKVDRNEFSNYYIAATGGGGNSYGGNSYGGNGGGWGGPPSSGRGSDAKVEEPDEPRPVIYRYGKLPPEFEKEFGSMDTDKDGQIGLYEWRTKGKEVEKFVSMDLNGDGLLTAEEYLRFKNLPVGEQPGSSKSSSTSGRPSFGGPGGSSSFGRGGPPSSSDNKDSKDKKDSKGDRKNPWSRN